MSKFICKSCGESYDIEELQDYEGECSQCGGDLPKNKEEYQKEVMPLWYRNRADQCKLYTFREIANGFFESQFYADYKAEINYPHIQRALVAYMTDKEGLNSSYDDSLLDNLLGYVLDNREAN